MALNFGFMNQPEGGQTFLPFVKYDSRAGRMFRVDKKADGSTENVDITRSFKALVDLENVETGWMHFAAGAAPIYALSRHDEPNPPKPVAEAKEGVRLVLQLGAACGGDVREISSNAKSMLVGISDLHSAYEAGLKDNPGKLPIVVLSDTKPVVTTGKNGSSTNYMPVFEIVGWAPRSSQLVWSPKGNTVMEAAAPAAPAAPTFAPASNAQAPRTGSTLVAPPAQTATFTAPPAASVSEDDFG